jgi:hypothetical protein
MLTLAITINDEVAHEDSDTINKKLLSNETMLHFNRVIKLETKLV